MSDKRSFAFDLARNTKNARFYKSNIMAHVRRLKHECVKESNLGKTRARLLVSESNGQEGIDIAESVIEAFASQWFYIKLDILDGRDGGTYVEANWSRILGL